MLKKILIFTLIINTFFLFSCVLADDNLANKLKGRILLQVEQNGEAWYLNPADEKKYYMGRPADAFSLMQNLGVGISNANLEKISIGLIDYDDKDDDSDGLANRLETAIGTDPNNQDTDNDGHADKREIENNYNPLNFNLMQIDNSFSALHAGKIFLQTEQNGEAWYLNPLDLKRYYLGRPQDAFLIMRRFGLGITNNNLQKILSSIANYTDQADQNNNLNNDSVCDTYQNDPAEEIFYAAAQAIRDNDKEKTIACFIPEMERAIEYTMDFLDAEGRLTLGNILSGSKLSESSDTEKTFSNEVYFSLGGYKVPVNFHVKKQPDGTWLLADL